ncbi:MAG TPA: hypothetical protein VGH88_18595 [Streptosporangiaceae bacterium]
MREQARSGKAGRRREKRRPRSGRLVLLAAPLGVLMLLSTGPAAQAAADGRLRAAAPAPALAPAGLSLAAAGSGSPAADRPDDPPLGVSLQTLSGEASGAIRIAGQPVRDTRLDTNGLYVAVLDRSTRAVAESGTVPRGQAGVAQLTSIARKWSGSDKYLMIVSGSRGLPAGDVAAMSALTGLLGGTGLSDAQQSQLRDSQPFSLLGVAGGAPGGMWSNIANGADGVRGDMQGYLQVNSGTNLYGFVSPNFPTFDTASDGLQPERNVITFNHASYPVKLRDVDYGFTAGFQILSVDSLTLRVISNEVLPTNGPPFPEALDNKLATALARASTTTSPAGTGHPPLLFIQSIGHPQGHWPGWTRAADIIQRLGGNRLAFNGLNGTTDDYTLVGSLQSGSSAVEASAALGQPGPFVGSLARTRDYSFQPDSAGPPHGVNTQLIDISYQTPKPFPPFDGAAQLAETYIGRKLMLCTAAEPTCDIRKLYYQLFQGHSWLQDAIDLNSAALNYPGAGHGFTEQEYGEVREELRVEISAVNRVRNYFEALEKPFGLAAQPGRIDLDTVGNEVLRAVSPPNNDKTSWTLGLIGKIAALGGFLPPPANGIAAGLSAGFALGAYLSAANGTSQLGLAVTARASELGKRLRQQMLDADDSLTGLALLIVSDDGKLTSTAAKLTTGDWRLPQTDTQALAQISLAARRWFAEQLVPLAFPWLIRGTPPPVGPGDANGLSCGYLSDQGMFQFHPWHDMPRNAQIRAVEAWTTDGKAIQPSYFFARVGFEEASASPSPGLANLLFNPENPSTGALGMNLLSFLSPRVFGRLRNADDTTLDCNLFR